MTTDSSDKFDQLISTTEEKHPATQTETDPHPFYLREDLEPWQHPPSYDPHLWLEPWQRRNEIGKGLREETPRKSHADWQPSVNHPDPIETIIATNQGRQEHLIPIRIGRMAASPFAFLRGAAAVMAWDLAQTPVSGIQRLIKVEEGLVDMVANVDENQPTILRRLMAIENKVDTLIERDR